MSTLQLVLAQINSLVGDIPGNTAQVIDVTRRAYRDFGAELVLFPELTLCGYPPEDLLLRPSMQRRVDAALAQLMAAELPCAILVGYPRVVAGKVFNMAGLIVDGRLSAEYAKQKLPNYQVFDELRYFVPGDKPCVVDIKGIPTAISICEDIWHPEPVAQAAAAGAKLMLNINASPFHRGKAQQRLELLAGQARAGDMPVVYVNWVGGQDELVFDGGSFAVDAQGKLCARAPEYVEKLLPVSVTYENGKAALKPGEITPALEDLASVYQALVLGVRDYVNKNGFNGVVLGLSGGIDSALTLAIAVDALGPERVEAVMMPFRYTSDLSKNDAAEQARRLGIHYRMISIEPVFDAFSQALADEFAGTERDTTEENLQARSRGVLLMAISNKKGAMVLTTGNKSELAVGYATLYGDMVGGYNALKDVPKTLVFQLARYRNSISEVIPETVITRPPSAELAPGQVDSDSLPPYEILDQILNLYIERDYSAEDIIRQGFERNTVERVVRLVDRNEYKRRQAAVGVRISERGFGRDRRYPITNGWKAGE
ncbi:NAD+ synthase [Microbulbifer thermotolerans]|uniref:NAD+ synthase n=1 Tax=Microbulbifer thermotolerans TaxID=252514 RepID=UPI00224ABDDF|nr:NAD+ synthase [Microbulbifer thermotolerans]MCX2780255.1 NAD+ synthase [Microbulbifer thermotolerans]MCX2783879.1 NAD+ synthase [Microbulbifer thermotolerans]MCX2805791.1 NAD+ synthase [Microbulbifer thermotolerans]